MRTHLGSISVRIQDPPHGQVRIHVFTHSPFEISSCVPVKDPGGWVLLPEGWPKALICCFQYFLKIVINVQKNLKKHWLPSVLCFKWLTDFEN